MTPPAKVCSPAEEEDAALMAEKNGIKIEATLKARNDMRKEESSGKNTDAVVL